jgi:methylmalonyl-CoA mutase cobalamin-binding subunit
MKVLGACLANDVHVAGVTRFLSIAEQCGCKTHFTGPATDLETLIDAARTFDPDIIGVSYRLTPENLVSLLDELKEMLAVAGMEDKRLAFAGTPPVVEIARRTGLFEAFFIGGETASEVQRYLASEAKRTEGESFYPQHVIERIHWKAPIPLIRHHYGEPAHTIEPTVRGIEHIADSGVLDVISLGPDQEAQEHFFLPHVQDPKNKGAGGVPLRTEQDLRRLYEASRCGNFPLLRSYSGTADHIQYADMLLRTINNAWCATSLFWFNAMDARGHSSLKLSLNEHMDLMRWHAIRGIPIEGNEPYHWGMRDAPDVVVCAVSAIYAEVVKAMGVQDYITTYMFESPPHLSNRMDLAKCLAQIDLAESYVDETFHVWRQTRTGLLSYPVDPVTARAHLAQSVMLQMTIQPHIVHVVGYTEADHASTADEVVESCRMATHVIDTALHGIPDMAKDPMVTERKQELLAETNVLLDSIRSLGSKSPHPLINPDVLTEAVDIGLLDAPQLVNNPFAKGAICTRSIEGAIRAVDDYGLVIPESERVRRCLEISRGAYKNE